MERPAPGEVRLFFRGQDLSPDFVAGADGSFSHVGALAVGGSYERTGELARASHMLRHVTDAIVLMDPDGVILENSDRTGRLLALPPEMEA